MEERPVPQTDVSGERISPTQPFPTKPPAFAKRGFSEDDVVDFTPEIREMAMEKLKDFRFGPIFNPPSIHGTLLMPSNGGGVNWGSSAVDLEKGLPFVKAKNLLRVIQLIKQEPGTPPDPRL
jgi:glucose dehydrogenase